MRVEERTISGKIVNLFIYAFFIAYMIICIYPFYYILIYSLSDPQKVYQGVYLWPKDFTLFNYKSVFALEGIFHSVFVSVMRTVIGTMTTVFCCTFVAYLVTKSELPARKFIYRFIIVTMYLSPGTIPVYLTIKAYGLRNNFLVYILPYALSAYYIILLKTYIEQIPPSLEESAMLDGAGYFTVFRKIIFPLSVSIVATIALFAAVGQWNAWFDNYLYCPDKSLSTLQYVLYKYLNEAAQKASSVVTSNVNAAELANALTVTPEGIRMTMTVVATVPIFMVYPFLQKYFAKGIMLGAVKG